MLPDLVKRANDFARQIEVIINGTVSTGAKMEVTQSYLQHEVADIAPVGSKIGKWALIPITSFLEQNEEPWLWLRVWFQVKLIGPNKHFGVESSAFGLAVTKESSRTLVRIEYDRDKGFEPDHDGTGKHTRNAAHVQIHGESSDLGYIKGRHKSEPTNKLEKIHFPVGGRRFRPTLEDFIEFLNVEGLIPKLKDEAREVLNENRKAWRIIQLRAAIENDVQTAIQAMDKLGFDVTKR